MSQTIEQILGEEKTEKETRTYTISARPEHLDKIEELFSWINSTRSGHSGGASISVDGDGAARVTIEKKDGELKSHDEEKVHTSQRIEFSVGLD
jgi:hypothetical protein